MIRGITAAPAQTVTLRAAAPAVLAVCAALSFPGCTSVARITTLSDPACGRTLTGALTKILQTEGETPAVAERLADSTAAALRTVDLGPRPFLVESPSGVDYSFFVERKSASCVLRLYARQKGFVSYTNNLTYIATEPLAPCDCAE
jgi:hypothetical protein